VLLMAATSSLLEQEDDCNVVNIVTNARAAKRLMLFVFTALFIIINFTVYVYAVKVQQLWLA
jgi:EamA domain-containing membrane protein RarD